MIALPSTMLFCPGDRPDRFPKAWSSSAPAVVLDLEDSVGAASKDAARQHVLAWLASDAVRAGRALPALRINPLRTHAGLEDLLAFFRAEGLPERGCLLVPKLDDAGERAWLEAHLVRCRPGWAICGLIESAAGLRNLQAIVQGSQRLAGLGFGAADLQAELGTGDAWECLMAARMMLVLAAAGTGIRLLDVPCLQLDDERRLLNECARARAVGFHGKFAVHPKQLGTVRSAFAPSEAELEQARRIVEVYSSSGGGACKLDGAMIDEPIYRQALRCIASAC